ncbi:hypothetical protein ABIE62_000897 [Porphyrobacter sp. MBR-155]|jgi:hypothetical protein|uniref:hypothetical protein n=1 Tax=Porphyrobacter sp. MBR-155 TaxID=3156464 RepID=UPI00339725AE
MSALTKGIFGKYAAPIALGIGAAATAFIPASGIAQTMQAQPAAANANIQATPVTWQTFDDRGREARFVQSRAAIASSDKIAVVVWGGNVELQRQAYAAAQDLRGQGIPLAFIVGPDLNGYAEDANFQIYARGLPQFEGDGANIGGANVAMVRPEVVRMGREAYARRFPRELAALDIR